MTDDELKAIRAVYDRGYTTTAANDIPKLLDEIERLRKERERSTDWYQQRFNRLRRWVEEEVKPISEEAAHRYFAICANGSPAPHESADWRETMHGLTLERDQARAKVRQITEEYKPGWVQGLEAENARLREALADIREWSKHDDFIRFDDGDIPLADYCARALHRSKP
jgi:hypothetical protein